MSFVFVSIAQNDPLCQQKCLLTQAFPEIRSGISADAYFSSTIFIETLACAGISLTQFPKKIPGSAHCAHCPGIY
jgi:hypothetical protein